MESTLKFINAPSPAPIMEREIHSLPVGITSWSLNERGTRRAEVSARRSAAGAISQPQTHIAVAVPDKSFIDLSTWRRIRVISSSRLFSAVQSQLPETAEQKLSYSRDASCLSVL
jgi:hypothetical protein